MEQAMLIAFAVFLLVLIFLDLAMVVSMLRPGDERKQMIVWKTSASTLLVTVLMLVFNVVEALIKKEPDLVNPFIHLSVVAMVYFVTLLVEKKRYGG